MLLLAWTTASTEALAMSSPNAAAVPQRPMISLTGEGDVSGFLYGKLQRATSLYGSDLKGPATAIIHGDRDSRELLPKSVAGATSKRQLRDLEGLLWSQFGMAVCEGSVEREDLLTDMSYLKPRLCDLRDTLVFLDVTAAGMRERPSRAGGAVDGLGGLFSSFLPPRKKEKRSPPAAEEFGETDGKECWIDVDLIRAAVPRGSGIFVVCESRDTKDCARALAECMETIGGDGIATLVSPDDGISLGFPDDARWNSRRAQDLEGELSRPVAVRNGAADCFAEEAAAAYDEDAVPPFAGAPAAMSRPDLAEVCVQCALRLSARRSKGEDGAVRVVRARPGGGEGGKERPNEDYFTRTGGTQAEVVASVDWARALRCFGRVREFPKRPDVL